MKIVDDVLFAAEIYVLKEVIHTISQRYKIGIIKYRLSITQDTDFQYESIPMIDLKNVTPASHNRIRLKELDEFTNSVDQSSYRSCNGVLRCIGVAVYPFCLIASSLM